MLFSTERFVDPNAHLCYNDPIDTKATPMTLLEIYLYSIPITALIITSCYRAYKGSILVIDILQGIFVAAIPAVNAFIALLALHDYLTKVVMNKGAVRKALYKKVF